MNSSLSSCKILSKIKAQWRQWLVKYQGKKVALYGAGEHSLWLEEMLSVDFYRMSICCFIDSSPKSKQLLNIPVKNRSECQLSEFDFIIISSKSAENEIYQSLISELPRDRVGRLYHRKRQDIFADIYNENHWGSASSISGPGSATLQTKTIESELALIFNQLSVKSVMDIPCGDFNWMQNIIASDIAYIGGDIVDAIISENKEKFTQKNINFYWLDLLTSPLPQADVIFCRDCLVHFSFFDIAKALRNIIKSDAKYFISTTFIERTTNHDISTGEWRPINLCAAPFNLPKPINVIIEQCTENNGNYKDKALGIWEMEHLMSYLKREENK